MLEEKILKERLKILEKLIKLGYVTDKRILDIKLEDLIKNSTLNRNDLNLIVDLKIALKSNNLIAFLSGINLKGGDKL